VVFSHRESKHIDLILSNHFVEIENKVIFLGLIFDSKLNWKEHIHYIEQKCKKRLNLMRAVAGSTWGANKKTLLITYRTLIWSIIDYGSIAYNAAPETTKNRLGVIQHKVLRIVCGAFCSTAASAMQVDTGELPQALRRSQQEIRYSVKVKCTDGHPAKSVTDFHWTTLSKKFIVSAAPIYGKTLQYFLKTNNQLTTPPTLPELPP